MGFPTPPQATGAVLAKQAEYCRLEWRETQADEKRTGDCHRGSAATGAFQESSKTECNQNCLQARIGGECGNRFLHHLKLSGFDCNVVEENGGDDDPGNPHKSEHNAQKRSVGNEEAGIPKTAEASTTAMIMPLSAATQTRCFRTRRTKNSVSTGSDETNVESCQKFNGS